jgi:hypothetical protein
MRLFPHSVGARVGLAFGTEAEERWVELLARAYAN